MTAMSTSKTCADCHQEKPVSDYYLVQSKWPYPYCKECHAGRSKKYFRENNGKALRAKYKRKYRYGLSQDDYDALFSKQGGVCAICRQPETKKSTALDGGVCSLAVDHDHETNKVRGLLCHSCNIAIGNMRDDPLIAMSATKYLLEHGHILLNDA